ncbi:MAG: glycosyltransferase [Fimbriimonadaceae bacterium]|nr:glycosyltransferase [Fimbriimonadaceae bacterium]
MDRVFSCCTVVVLARNEAARIAACLGSAEGLDVLVLSMGSTDDTVGVAESLGARVVEVPFVEEFDRARNLASRYADTPWILFLDADERLTPRAIQRIEELLESAPEDVAAFSLPYKTISFGRWIRHAGNWWPSHKSPALVRRERFHFPGGVHEPCRIAGRIEKVLPRSDDEAIVHESHRDLSHYLEKLNRYTSLETRKEVAGKRELGWPSLARRFGSNLGWFYDETEGKRDGLAGWLLSVGSALYELATDLKLSETAPGRAVIPPSAEAFLREASLASSGQRSSEPSWAPWLREQARCCTIVPAERDARRRPDSTLVAEVGDRLSIDRPQARSRPADRSRPGAQPDRLCRDRADRPRQGDRPPDLPRRRGRAEGIPLDLGGRTRYRFRRACFKPPSPN